MHRANTSPAAVMAPSNQRKFSLPGSVYESETESGRSSIESGMSLSPNTSPIPATRLRKNSVLASTIRSYSYDAEETIDIHKYSSSLASTRSNSSCSSNLHSDSEANLEDLVERRAKNTILVTPQAVLASLPDLESFLTAVVIGSIHGIIIGCNTMAEQLFGYTKEEMINQPVTILMPEPHRSRHDAYLFRHEKFGTENLMGKPRQLEGMTKEGIVFPIILSLGKLHIDGYYLACFIQMPNAP